MNAEQSARRFFWAWLAGSAAVSTLGTVTHAVLGAAPSPVIASAVAFFTVAIQLAATYGVHALAQAGLVGAAYRTALCIAITLAALAFIVNFVQLRDLVITWAAIPTVIAWIVPLTVDLGMTGSLVALLALTNVEHAEQLQRPVVHHDAQGPAVVNVEVHNTMRTEAPIAHDGAPLELAQRVAAKAGVRIEVERVAQVLAVHAQTGATPSIIARQTGVHHKTVKRILEHQETPV
ncbi:hypothetical protein B7435_26840 [Mycolicibacterium peregrinum]|uniref:DUF2637 domain-containing protein n=1 Tax=Mycolicibacterium peregrinum TaxID=43304 RepID=UPI000B4B0F79|nr:DUF2637 domain-containing protein [Mycolicibacterium peregrinum]OWL97006.1 hypothetical protein B7435_26840 [Mycolicibacterium peregrinum]